MIFTFVFKCMYWVHTHRSPPWSLVRYHQNIFHEGDTSAAGFNRWEFNTNGFDTVFPIVRKNTDIFDFCTDLSQKLNFYCKILPLSSIFLKCFNQKLSKIKFSTKISRAHISISASSGARGSKHLPFLSSALYFKNGNSLERPNFNAGNQRHMHPLSFCRNSHFIQSLFEVFFYIIRTLQHRSALQWILFPIPVNYNILKMAIFGTP